MVERIIRIIKLDFSVFKEIESDPNATTEAAIVVAGATLLSSLGSAFGAARPGQAAVGAFFSGLIGGLLGWVVWAAVTHYVGRALYKSGGTFQSMLRVLGYASAPQCLGILGFIPCFGALAAMAGAVLSLIAGVMAISEGLDVDTTQAIIVAVIGWVALFAVTWLIGLVFGGTALATAGLCSAISR